jgi:hypothetical protein
VKEELKHHNGGESKSPVNQGLVDEIQQVIQKNNEILNQDEPKAENAPK